MVRNDQTYQLESPWRVFWVVYSEYRYEYDRNGRLIKDIRFNLDETIDWCQSLTYKYDATDRLIAENNHNESGGIDRITKYEYDTNSNLVSQTVAGSDGLILSSRKSKLNKTVLKKNLLLNKMKVPNILNTYISTITMNRNL